MIFKPKKYEHALLFGTEIFIVERKNFVMTNLLTGKIQISRELTTQLSKRALEILIRHEEGHSIKLKTRTQRFFSILYFYVLPFLVSLLVSIIAYFVNIELSLIIIVFTVTAITLMLYLSYKEEKYADIYSAKRTGKENFILGFKEIREKFPKLTKTFKLGVLTHGTWNSRIKRINKVAMKQ